MVEQRCYDEKSLHQIVAGTKSSDELEIIERHVMECDRCATTLERLLSQDTLADALQSTASGDQQADKLQLQAIKRRLLSLCPVSQTDDALTVAPAPAASDPTLDISCLLQPAESADEIGRLGEYRVLKSLGDGGMGVVFLAEDVRLKRPVALKVMKREIAANPIASERFLREAQSTAALDHDNIVTIYQVGEQQGMPFLAMQLLAGSSLKDLLDKGKPLQLKQILRITTQIAEGLAVAHDAGLIHRDIKPGNLWLEPVKGGRIKILDFGLARTVKNDASVTKSGQILGTPAYMAPEQARGERVDARADLFSLGCVMYQMCTGQTAFRGRDTLSVLMSLATDDPTPPHQVNPKIPQGLSDIVMKLLQKEAGNRYASAHELLAALRQIDPQAVKMTVPNLEDKVAVAPATPRSALAGTRPTHSGSMRRWMFIAAALFVVGGLVWWLFGGIIFRVQTENGELVVKVNDPAIQVKVVQNGVVVHDKTGKRTFTLNAGAGLIEVYEKDGVKLLTRKFTLTRGKRTTVEVSLAAMAKARKKNERPAPVGDSPFDHLRREDIDPENLKMAGLGDPSNAPKELVAVWGDSRMRGYSGMYGVSFHPNGKQIAFGTQGAVIVSDIATRNSIHIIPSPKGLAGTPKFSANGKWLAVRWRGDDSIRLLDANTVKEVRRFEIPSSNTNSFDFGPDSKRLTAVDGHSIYMWDVETGRRLFRNQSPKTGPWQVAFNPNGKQLAVCGRDLIVRVLNSESGEELFPLTKVNAQLSALTFKPDGKCLMFIDGLNATIRTAIWDLNTRKVVASVRGPRHTAMFNPEGTLVIGTDHQWLTVSDATNGKILRKFEAHKRIHTMGLAFSRDGRMMASINTDSSALRLWRTDTWEDLGRPKYQVGPLSVKLIDNGNRVASLETGQRPMCIIRDSRNGKIVSTANAFAVSANGKFGLSHLKPPIYIQDGCHVWDINSKRKLFTIPGPRSVSFSPDNKQLATIHGPNTVKFWSIASGAELAAWTWKDHYIRMVLQMPDGRLVAWGQDNEKNRRVIIYNPKTGNIEKRFERSYGALTVSMSSCGKYIAEVYYPKNSHQMKVWETETDKKLFSRSARNGNAYIRSLAFSPDSKTVVCGDDGGGLMFFESTTGKRRRTIQLPGAVYNLTFAPDGRHLITGNSNGTVYVLRLANSSLVKAGR